MSPSWLFVLKSSPYLDVVNIAGVGVGFAPGIPPMLVTMAVPVAVRLAKTAEAEKKWVSGFKAVFTSPTILTIYLRRRSTSFLTRANRELFLPHGLFAMVMTYKPTTTSQTYTVDTSQPSPWETDATTTSPSYNAPQLPAGVLLIFPEHEPSPAVVQQNKFRQIGHFTADYEDGRAQARYAYKHPNSTLATPPPTFRSRWGDPNNPANSGGLVSLISGRPRDRDDKRKERKDRRRRRRRKSTSSSIEGEIKMIKNVRAMATEPSKEDQSLIKGLKGMGMKKVSLQPRWIHLCTMLTLEYRMYST
jgi:hypothetical protein